jgi:hypothetical protein
MRIRYDEKIDALYFRLDDSKVVESEEVKPGGAFPRATSSSSKCSSPER